MAGLMKQTFHNNFLTPPSPAADDSLSRSRLIMGCGGCAVRLQGAHARALVTVVSVSQRAQASESHANLYDDDLTDSDIAEGGVVPRVGRTRAALRSRDDDSVSVNRCASHTPTTRAGAYVDVTLRTTSQAGRHYICFA